jgi:hypothetical protein
MRLGSTLGAVGMDLERHLRLGESTKIETDFISAAGLHEITKEQSPGKHGSRILICSGPFRTRKSLYFLLQVVMRHVSWGFSPWSGFSLWSQLFVQHTC